MTPQKSVGALITTSQGEGLYLKVPPIPSHYWQVDGKNSFGLFLLSLRKFLYENVSKYISYVGALYHLL